MSRYYYHGWTDDEEQILASSFIQGAKSRKKADEILKEVSERLGRTLSACHNRWYGRYGIRERYIEELNKRN